MSTINAKTMLAQMKLTDEAVGAIVANDGQGLIKILNEKSVEGLCKVLQKSGGTAEEVSNSGVVVSSMAEANLQGTIYYIKNSKRIGRTCTHANVDLVTVRAIYYHQDMEEAHKDPEVVPTVDPKY